MSSKGYYVGAAALFAVSLLCIWFQAYRNDKGLMLPAIVLAVVAGRMIGLAKESKK